MSRKNGNGLQRLFPPPGYSAALYGQFITERLIALKSLDRNVILDYARKWQADLIATDGETFWAAVHKARLVLPGMTEQERTTSRTWLQTHGFSAKIQRHWRNE